MVVYFTWDDVTYDYRTGKTISDAQLSLLGFSKTVSGAGGSNVELVSGGRAPVARIRCRGVDGDGNRASCVFPCSPSALKTALDALLGEKFEATAPGTGVVSEFTIEKTAPKTA